MKNILLLYFLLFSCLSLAAQRKTVYLIPGTGADGRLFERLALEGVDTVHLEYLEPIKKETFDHYINRMAAGIDTTKRYSIIGVSLGGMIASELADRIAPEEVVVIAGAKNQHEIPKLYHLFRHLPLHHIIGGRTMIWSTKQLQPIFEPMSAKDRAIFQNMLEAKSYHFIKSAVRWMINWEKDDFRPDIVHIHGKKDHTLPFKNVAANHVIQEGGHMITYSQAEEVSKILNTVLTK